MFEDVHTKRIDVKSYIGIDSLSDRLKFPAVKIFVMCHMCPNFRWRNYNLSQIYNSV